MVLVVSHPCHETSLLGPVDQAHRTVVTEQEVVGHFAHRRPAAVRVPPDGQQQLLLRRRHTGRLCLLLAPAEKAPQTRTERQQVFVVGVGQSHRITIPSFYDE